MIARGTTRTLAAILVAAALAMAGPARGTAATIRAGIASPTWTFVPLQVAMDNGFFARQGLHVARLTFAGGARLQQGMVGGAADIALSGSTDFAYLLKGAPEIAVGGLVGPPLALGVVVVSPKIRTMADLRGKRIGVSSPGALTGWLASELAHSQGWPPSAITLVSLGGIVSTQGAALRTGSVDAIVTDTALGYEFEAKHVGRLLFPSSFYVHHFLTNSIYAANGFAKDHPEELRRFLAAIYQAAAWTRTHKKATIEAGAKISKLPLSVLSRQYDASDRMFVTDGHISDQQLHNVAVAIQQTHLWPKVADLHPYYTPRFLPPEHK